MNLAEFLLNYWDAAFSGLDGQSVIARWEAQRFASLADMNNYNVWQLGLALVWLKEFEGASKPIATGKNRDNRVPDDVLEQIKKRVAYARNQAVLLELEGAIDRADQLSVLLNTGLTFDQLRHEIRILREALEARLPYRRFAYVPTEKAKRLDNIETDWETALAAFRNARKDIRAAVECYALDCNTAAVFHGMRVVEWGLRALCVSLGFRRLKQKFKKSGNRSYIPIEYSEWENILNQLQERIDSKINKIKRGPLKQQHQEFYYPVLQDIRGIRDAWRNHVMHTRQEYEPKDADAILEHVKRLMNTLATRIREV